VRASSGKEPGGCRTEHELEHLSPLSPHLQTPAVIVNRENNAVLKASAEVRNPRPSADMRELS
jgi:hypothetical protein